MELPAPVPPEVLSCTPSQAHDPQQGKIETSVVLFRMVHHGFIMVSQVFAGSEDLEHDFTNVSSTPGGRHQRCRKLHCCFLLPSFCFTTMIMMLAVLAPRTWKRSCVLMEQCWPQLFKTFNTLRHAPQLDVECHGLSLMLPFCINMFVDQLQISLDLFNASTMQQSTGSPAACHAFAAPSTKHMCLEAWSCFHWESFPL